MKIDNLIIIAADSIPYMYYSRFSIDIITCGFYKWYWCLNDHI